MFQPTIHKKVSKMKPWSDAPIHQEFTAKVFLDTNILTYLVDDTFVSLTSFFAIAKESPFCELVCSKYVMFEFVGIRKREHYLRKVAAKVKKSAEGELNFSSLLNLKYVNSFAAPEVEFNDVIGDIKAGVEKEIEKITTDLGVNFSYSVIHDDQLAPTFDICLSSKISNQDSLVLISSILPTSKENATSVIVFTNDGDFSSVYNGNAAIATQFQNHKLQQPHVKLISNIGGNVNLKAANHTQSQLGGHFCKMILEALVQRNQNKFLGHTFPPAGANFPNDVVSFQLVENYALSQDVYVTIVSKNLDFIYTTKRRVSFWQNGAAVPAGYNSPPSPNPRVNTSFKVIAIDDDNNPIAPSQEVMDALRDQGNYVFIHPDN